MTDQSRPLQERGHTVTEAAIIDLERQREAMMARAKNFDPKLATAERHDLSLPAGTIDNLTRPVRIEITFTDPLHTRQQLDLLAAAIVEAQVLTQQHELGIMRQRLRLRETMKTAADMLVYLNGKTPTGRKKPGAR
jgi:hypothetical protein